LTFCHGPLMSPPPFCQLQVLQTLLVLLNKDPPINNNRLLVIGTTASSLAMEDLQLAQGFQITLGVPQVTTLTVTRIITVT
jgi:hypothetical protein